MIRVEHCLVGSSLHADLRQKEREIEKKFKCFTKVFVAPVCLFN